MNITLFTLAVSIDDRNIEINDDQTELNVAEEL